MKISIGATTTPIQEKLNEITILTTAVNAFFALGFSLYFAITNFNLYISLIVFPIIFMNFAPLWWGLFFKNNFIVAKILYLFFSFLAVFLVSLILGPKSNVHLLSILIVIDSLLFLGYQKIKYVIFFALLTIVSFFIPILKIEISGLTQSQYLQTEGDVFRLAIEIVVVLLIFFKVLILAKLTSTESKKADLAIQDLSKAVLDKHFLVKALLHDIRAPLSSCIVALKNLKNTGIKNTSNHPSLIAIESGHQSMKEIMDNLSILNSDLKKIQVVRSRQNLNELINAAISVCSSRIIEKKIQLKTQYSDDDIIINVDRDTVIYQILGNLLSNGIKFSKPGDLFEISIKIKNEVCEMELKNIGCLDENILNKKSFSTQGTWGEKGSGVGLTIVRQFAELNKIEFNIFNKENYVIAHLRIKIEKQL